MSTGENKVLFRESQSFASGWLLPIVAGMILVTNLLIMAFFREIHYKGQFWDVVFFVTSPFIVFIFYFIRLDTEIDEEGIQICFTPFVRRKILFDEISGLYIRKYRPIVEYGGWGIKGWKRSNMAYNIRGNTGLQLELSNSNRVLIGTQKTDELVQVLDKLRSGG